MKEKESRIAKTNPFTSTYTCLNKDKSVNINIHLTLTNPNLKFPLQNSLILLAREYIEVTRIYVPNQHRQNVK